MSYDRSSPLRTAAYVHRSLHGEENVSSSEQDRAFVIRSLNVSCRIDPFRRDTYLNAIAMVASSAGVQVTPTPVHDPARHSLPMISSI